MGWMSPSAAELALRVERDSEVPLGVQLAWAVRERIAARVLTQGDRLPSVRDLAAGTGVNVNTARAVYAKLERDGVVRSEQGRGTFVAGAPASAAPPDAEGDRWARRELRGRIAALEAELARRPPPATAADGERGRYAAPRLMSTGELNEVHDQLRERLRELDAARADVLRRLEALEGDGAAEEDADRRSTVSLRGARVRWLGA